MNDIVKPQDYKYILSEPEAGFSAERNRQVVEDSIKEYEAMRAKKMKEHIEGVAERTDAIASYLKSRAADSGRPIDKYLGKQITAYMRGESIQRELERLVIKGMGLGDLLNEPQKQKRSR